MARARSPEKRNAILNATVYEIAAAGLGASTAQIAKRAGIAAGTLFTYFATKEELLNELYLELKGEVYTRVNQDFPHKGNLERRARHIWSSFLDWAVDFPEKRKASMQLNVSGLITPETLKRSASERSTIDQTLQELESREAFRGLPAGFATAILAAMQEAAMEFVVQHPKRRGEIIQSSFRIFWRIVR